MTPNEPHADANESSATTANHRADAVVDSQRSRQESGKLDGQSRRTFGKLVLAGTAGALGLSGTSAAREQSGWREGYRQYAQDYVPNYYKSVPKKDNLYKTVQYVADNTNFWETLGKKMYLDQAVVTAAYTYPLPNSKKVETKEWDGILGDMYSDMPSKYKKKRKYPVAVPVTVVYLYDGYYNAVAYLRPYGSSYKSYGYAIKNGYQDYPDYSSIDDYKSNTWWWTEDGWGDAGDTEGGILDGVPTGDNAPQSRRGFGKLMLAGTAGALGRSGTSAAREQSGWREGYRKYAKDYVSNFYKSVPKKDNLYKCMQYEADNTNFWDTMYEKMYPDRTVVTAAYTYLLPNYKKVETKTWDGILSDMYSDMPSKYKKKRKYPVAVPVTVVYLYDGYYNAVAYLRPYGSSYKSYGYAIKNGYQDYPAYRSMSDYESNTWWWTEDGWGDAGSTDGGILDGVPTPLTDN
jgi:ribosomal protein L20A (L18A)